MESFGIDALIDDSVCRDSPCMIDAEELLGNADLDRLVELYGDTSFAFDVSRSPIQTPGQDEGNTGWLYHRGRYRGTVLPMSEGVNRISNSELFDQHYQLVTPFGSVSRWFDVNQIPAFLQFPKNTYVLLGNQSTGASLHYDPYDVYLFVSSGEKRVWLWRPQRLREFGIRPINSYLCATSRHAWADSGLSKYLESFRSADAMVQVKARQCLYIPDGWYHVVVNESLTVAFSTVRRPMFRHRLCWRNIRVNLSRNILRRMFAPDTRVSYQDMIEDPECV